MKRKDFNSLILAGGVLGMTACAVPSKVYNSTEKNSRSKIKPQKLKRGDTIGLISPGSPFSEEAYAGTLENINKLGLKYKNADNLFKKYGYVAGSDKERIDDIHQMFADKEVDAIWCVRGGYGTTRLLYDLDYDLIRNNPKIIIGYSDITALLQAITKMTGLVTYHGPVGSSNLTPYTLENFKNVLMRGSSKIKIPYFETDKTDTEYSSRMIVSGEMKGELAGGNLSLLSAMAGTPYNLVAKGKIVFIEDVGEKPYRIDRMLTQLVQTSKLKEASGLLLGIFNDCEAKEGAKNTLKLNETIIDRLGSLGIPVFYGFSFGHISDMCTLPVGIKATFDMDKRELILLESAVS